MSKPIRVGLLRLVDSAPIIVAKAHGLFREQGIDVQISIEPSWSNIADKLTYGILDAAVMLPPLALASCAGLRGPKARLVVPMSLSQGGSVTNLERSKGDCDAPLTRATFARNFVVPSPDPRPSSDVFTRLHATLVPSPYKECAAAPVPFGGD